jgi:uncharacterized protein (TIGR03435 family)
MTRTGAVWMFVAILSMCSFAGQQSTPRFDSLSIRRSPAPFDSLRKPKLFSPSLGDRTGMPDGGVLDTYATLQELLSFAYGLQRQRMVGLPTWSDDPFDFVARTTPDVSMEMMRSMVRTALEERFKFVGSIRPREMSYFTLSIMRKDGTIGPYLRQVQDCKQLPPRPTLPEGFHVLYPRCESMQLFVLRTVAEVYSREPVVDNTGLTGTFDYFRVVPANVLREDTSKEISVTQQRYKEWFGLNLEQVHGPLDVLVIDSVSPPTAD